MPTYNERFKIETDSRSDPLAPPVGSTTEEVAAAVAFRGRVRSVSGDTVN